MIELEEPVLLDTSLVLVSLGEPERLTNRARKLLLNQRTSHQRPDLLGSCTEIHEREAGSRRRPPVVDGLCVAPRSRTHSPTSGHIAVIAGLPPIHKDPFDRALLAQAAFEGLTLLTSDETL